MSSIENKAAQLLKNNEAARAEQLLKPHVLKDAGNHKLLHLYGLAASLQYNYAEALERLKRVVSLKPGIAEYQHNIATVYKQLGDFDKADAHFRKAIKLKPDYAEAYYNYANSKKFSADDQVIKKIESLIKNKDISSEDRCFLGFAGGKIFNDIKKYDKSFKYYTTGNQAANLRFDIDRFRSGVDGIIKAFNKNFIKKKEGKGINSKVPVFIVGMPRSGTTLVEQILSSHEDVYGAGELRDIAAIVNTMINRINPDYRYPQGVAEIPDDFYSGYANAYLKKLRTLDHSAVRIIDKMPDNFLRLGMIALMLPNARIIHCKRDPLDTCLSCYFQRFTDKHAYSYDLATLGHYYREYERLMQHWEKVLPEKPYELDYSELVSNQEKVTRELVAYCGLDWDPACLDFHKNPRPVATASLWQVRNPVFKTGLDRWKNYEKHLGPLKQALDYN